MNDVNNNKYNTTALADFAENVCLGSSKKNDVLILQALWMLCPLKISGKNWQ